MESIIIYAINTILGIAIGWLTKRYNRGQKAAEQMKHDNEILKSGFQALLRNTMVKDYNRAVDRGYMTIEAKDSFEAVYQAYHRMGANGVMDNIRQRVIEMPTSPQGGVK